MDDPGDKPHRGPNMGRIPAAGIPGLVFALGTMWMFWFGAPTYRPAVVGAGILGVIAAVVLIGWRAKHPQRVDKAILGLRDRDPRDAGADGRRQA